MIKKEPIVTIGISFYNPGKLLELAIRSVFAQSYKNWELILIDDGSTDGSFEMCKNIKDKRIKIFSDRKNLGLAARKNQIIELATGEYIAWLDADDIMHPKRVEIKLKYMEENPQLEAIASGAYILDRNNNVLGIRRGKKPTSEEIFTRGGYIHPTLFARTVWYRDNLYSTRYPYAEDRELFARTVKSAKIFVIEDPLYFYRWEITINKLLKGYKFEREKLY